MFVWTNLKLFNMTGRYQKLKNLLFGRYLGLTNTISCGVLLTFGDMIQQRIEVFTNSSQSSSYLDAERIGNYVAHVYN